MNKFYTVAVLVLIIAGSASAQLNIDFEASNIITGYLGSYSSVDPANPGFQLKAAYPAPAPYSTAVSGWYSATGVGADDLKIVASGVTYSNYLLMQKKNDYIEFGPVNTGSCIFKAIQFSGPFQVGVRYYDNLHTYVTGSTVVYNLNAAVTTIVVAAAVPQGGYVQIFSDKEDDFYIDDISFGGGVAPVELTSFRSYLKNNQVELQWTTATELNNYGFEVERSVNGDDWSTLGFVAGHGTCFTPQQYSFRDAQLDRSATELYYRLKQMDRDGTTEYSDVLRVALATPTSMNLSVYPQPFANRLNIDLAATGNERVRITLYNSAMQKVKSIYEGTADGTMSMVVPTTDLRDGSYFLIVNHANGRTQIQKLLHMQSR
jgi:hypothetical protein